MGRAKLGLALAGGGFRASLFHVGVLRRMAEMDLLRYVEVLSTVSGGSIVGAQYLLLLKERLEDAAHDGTGPQRMRLTPEDYVRIVQELQDTLVLGVQRNLRTRLLLDPIMLLRVMLTSQTLGTAMARLYERQFFAGVVKRLRPRAAEPAPGLATRLPPVPDRAPHRAGSISIRAMRLRRNEVRQAGGSEDYNRAALDPTHDAGRGGPGSAVTRLIVNATSLNSGARFWFSHAEFGDWYFGHVRYDEIDGVLLPIKILLELREPEFERLEERLLELRGPDFERLDESLKAAIREAAEPLWLRAATPVLRAWRLPHGSVSSLPRGSAPTSGLLVLARWWKTLRDKAPVDHTRDDVPWNDLDVEGFDLARFARQLADAEAGRLRDVKAFAWYLHEGSRRQPPVDGGFAAKELHARFWDALEGIDERAAQALRQRIVDAGSGTLRASRLRERIHRGLWQLVLDTFNLRMAQLMSPRCKSEWDRLPLSHAVTASAAFPPAFPPFLMGELFDDLQVRVLGLTDGGVFDNLGTTALLDEQCNYIVASDPGGVFEDRQQRSSVGRIGLTGRLSEILGERPNMLYRHDLRERRRLGRAADDRLDLPEAAERYVTNRALRALVLFRIDSERLEPRPRPPGWRKELARLRTDLDAFGDVEIKALINEGYLLADQYLRAELVGTPLDPATRTRGAPGWSAATEPPLPLHRPEADVQRILAAGRSRFLRALMLQAPLSVACVVAALAAIVAGAWAWPLSWERLTTLLGVAGAEGLPRLALAAIEWIPPLTLIPVVEAIPLAAVVTLLALAVLGWIWLREPVTRKLQVWRDEGRIPPRLARHWAAVVRTLRMLRGWLLLLLVPVAAVVLSVGALLANELFTRPFLRRTRDPKGLHPDRPRPSRRR